MEPSKSPNYAIPGAIVIAGVLVAGAVLYGRSPSLPSSQGGQQVPPAKEASTEELIKNVPLPVAGEHILGLPAAPVSVIEYSDIECPFCRRFHSTMQKIMTDYEASGKVSWTYRQFPLSIHPKAYPESLAAECVATNYDNASFWKFVSALMELEPETDPNEFPPAVISDNLSAEERVSTAAKKLSLDYAKISSCVTAETFKSKLEALRTEAIGAGLGANNTGTPYTVIISKGNRVLIDGAQPYSVVKGMIETALTN